MTAIGVAWIPIVQNFSELFHYIQSVSSFFAPPICAVYLLAVLWRRTNEQVRVQSRHLATLKLLLSVGVSYKCFLHFPFSACNSLSLGSHTSSFYLFISVLSLSIIFTHKSSVFFSISKRGQQPRGCFCLYLALSPVCICYCTLEFLYVRLFIFLLSFCSCLSIYFSIHNSLGLMKLRLLFLLLFSLFLLCFRSVHLTITLP